jgi:hypothetical protein
VHNGFAIVFLGCVFFFRMVDNGSLIDILLKMAGFTYGPLLGLFAFGILTRRSVWQRMPFVVCLTSLVATFIIDLLNNPEWYSRKLGFSPERGAYLSGLSTGLFHGYRIGTELLIINAGLTFLLLLLCSKKGALTAAPVS